MTFADEVYNVLADTTNLPDGFLSGLQQWLITNPVANAPASGDLVAYGTATTLTTTGTTFATGANLLAADLPFNAPTGRDYVLRVSAPLWSTATVGDPPILHISLDGADQGIIAQGSDGDAHCGPLLVEGLVLVAAGPHTINATLVSTAGALATVTGSVGGAGSFVPIVVSLKLP